MHAPEQRPKEAPTRRFLRPILLIVLSFAVAWIVIGFVGRIDWGAVVSAVGRLHAWQAIPLLCALLVRQYLNAVPLARFVPGLGTVNSMRNDLAANLAGTFAPPPGDVVVRVAMFNSWGINPVQALSASTLNLIMFYSVRFIAPIAGVLVVGVERVDLTQLATALLLALLSVGLLGAMLLAMRGQRLAALVGYSAGRVARRFRAEVDPDTWAQVVVDFRAKMAKSLHRDLAVGLVAMCAMVLADCTILGMALRFVGVPGESLPASVILGTFLMAYPLTVLPMFGLGVLDAALIAVWVQLADSTQESAIVAGLVVWRAVTILGTLGLGAIVMAHWRRAVARSRTAGSPA